MTEPLRVAPCAELAADSLTKAGAIEIARRLAEFWAREGATTVRHWVVPAGKQCTAYGVYTVRSNLVRGMPPRSASETPLNAVFVA